jgi:hypothetical protein
MTSKQNHIRLIFFTSLFSVLGCVANAQTLDRTVVASAGKVLVSGGLSLEFTLGETVVGQFSNSSNILSQGFNQGDANATNSVRSTAPELYVKVWPNPASSLLKVSVDESAVASVCDLSGKTILVDISLLKNQEGAIDISSLSSGIYFLKISTASKSATVMWVKD